MRSPSLARSSAMLRLTGTPSETAMVSALGARAGIALGILIPGVLLVHPGSEDALTITCAVFAFGAGAFLTWRPAVFPLPVLDVLLVTADVLLAVLGIHDDALHPALTGTYVIIGTIVFAVRPWAVAAAHACLLLASYASVLWLGPDQTAPLIRWLGVVGAVGASGLFIRWLVAQVLRLAEAEVEARELVEAATVTLREVSDLRSSFLARMSHELRTPLNAVVGFGDLLAEQVVGPMNDTQLAYVQDISAAGRHQVALIDDVLDLAKVESGLHELALEQVAVDSVLGEAHRLVRDAGLRKGVESVVDVAPDIGEIVADRLRIRQVVVNLLGNAVKFTPDGGVIALEGRSTTSGVLITVRDTGVGMTPEELELAFEEYARADPRTEGTGLGLPLARRFVELHGGRLRATSVPGEGSVFEVELPRQPRPTAPRPRPASDRAERDDYTAFTRPGSAANRALIARIATCFLIATAVLFAVLLLATRSNDESRALVAAAGAVWALWGLAARRWVPTLSRWAIELMAWIGILAISVEVVVADGFTSTTALAYGCVVTTSFGLWRRRTAVAFLIGIAASYAVALAIVQPGLAVARWLSLVVLLAFQAEIVAWVADRLRLLVTAEHNAHESAEAVRAELDQVSRHKSAFLANMSHELRTPLNAIIGFADLLASEVAGPLTETQREFVSDIQVAARHLLTVITLALDVARLEAGRMPLALDVVGVGSLLERAVAAGTATECDAANSLAGHDQMAKARVQVTVEPGAEFVVADPHLLQQAVAHLIGNAVRFSPPDAVVSVAAFVDGNVLRVDVHDAGAADLSDDRIFEPFHQDGHAKHGAGLGLALVSGVAALHGGSVTSSGSDELGSTFSLTVPRVVQGADALEAAVGGTW